MSSSPPPAPASLAGLIELRQAELELTDLQLSKALGFDCELIVKLIKAGSMKLSLSRVPALAAALGLEPADLLMLAIHESDPTLGKLIEDVLNPLRLSTAEKSLIMHLRESAGDLSQPDFSFKH